MQYSKERELIFEEKKNSIKKNLIFIFTLIILTTIAFIGSFFLFDFMKPDFITILITTFCYIFSLANIFGFYYNMSTSLDKEMQEKLDALNKEKNAISMEKLS